MMGEDKLVLGHKTHQNFFHQTKIVNFNADLIFRVSIQIYIKYKPFWIKTINPFG